MLRAFNRRREEGWGRVQSTEVERRDGKGGEGEGSVNYMQYSTWMILVT